MPIFVRRHTEYFRTESGVGDGYRNGGVVAFVGAGGIYPEAREVFDDKGLQ